MTDTPLPTDDSPEQATVRKFRIVHTEDNRQVLRTIGSQNHNGNALKETAMRLPKRDKETHQ